MTQRSTLNTLQAQRELAALLVSRYDSQKAINDSIGYQMAARTGLPVAADIPTISAAGYAGATPAVDTTDPASNRILITITNRDASSQFTLIPANEASEMRRWISGTSAGLPVAYQGVPGGFFRAAQSFANLGAAGNTLSPAESLRGFGGSMLAGQWQILSLNSDVLYFAYLRNQAFRIFVNGSLVTSAPLGANVTQSGLSYQHSVSGAAFAKLKWPSKAVRQIAIQSGNGATTDCGDLYTRSGDTITSVLDANRTVCWFGVGDSFSASTGVGAGGFPWQQHFQSHFGGFHANNVISSAIGSTSFSGSSNIRPGDVFATGLAPSQRMCYELHGAANNPDVLFMMIGHNDSSASNTTTASARFRQELSALLDSFYARFPSSLIAVFGSNASPGIITNGTAAAIEGHMATVCSTRPWVTFCPMQVGAAPFGQQAQGFTYPMLSGTGNVSAPNGTGNADLYVSSDGTHPSTAGHQYYGQQLAQRFYAALKLKYGV